MERLRRYQDKQREKEDEVANVGRDVIINTERRYRISHAPLTTHTVDDTMTSLRKSMAATSLANSLRLSKSVNDVNRSDDDVQRRHVVVVEINADDVTTHAPPTTKQEKHVTFNTSDDVIQENGFSPNLDSRVETNDASRSDDPPSTNDRVANEDAPLGSSDVTTDECCELNVRRGPNDEPIDTISDDTTDNDDVGRVIVQQQQQQEQNKPPTQESPPPPPLPANPPPAVPALKSPSLGRTDWLLCWVKMLPHVKVRFSLLPIALPTTAFMSV